MDGGRSPRDMFRRKKADLEVLRALVEHRILTLSQMTALQFSGRRVASRRLKQMANRGLIQCADQGLGRSRGRPERVFSLTGRASRYSSWVSIAIIAHRACLLHAPENSLAGIRKAAELGADGVEIDLRRTLDGVPVLMHDRSPWRTARLPGPAFPLRRRPGLRHTVPVPVRTFAPGCPG